MNWEYVNEYAWDTLGQVRRKPISDFERMGGDGRTVNHVLDDAAKPKGGNANE